jgi:ribosomal 30S subunit maturation factor RimM
MVKGSGREYLIPAVEDICIRISIEEKQILVDPPEGLMDLNK